MTYGRPDQPLMERLVTAPTPSTQVRWSLEDRAADVPERYFGISGARRVRRWGSRAAGRR